MEAFTALQPVDERTNITFLALLCCIDHVNQSVVDVIEKRTTKISQVAPILKNDRKFSHGYNDSSGKYHRVDMSMEEILHLYVALAATNIDDSTRRQRLNSYQQSAFMLGSNRHPENYLSKYAAKLKKIEKFMSPRRGF